MADTIRTKSELLALFADGQGIGAITPQDVRDLIVTAASWADGLLASGYQDVNDAATATTAINVVGGGGDVVLTNDAAGAFTASDFSAIPGVTTLWDTSTNRFDFSTLSLGDVVEIRLDIVVTTTAPSQEIEVDLVLAEGTPSEYTIPFVRDVPKSAGANEELRYNGLYIGNAATRDNPAKFVIRSPDDCSVEVKGWYIKLEAKRSVT